MDKKANFEYFNDIDIAITVCDNDYKIIYMNKKAIKTFENHGNLIGKNMLDCHNEDSKKKIKSLIQKNEKNVYTIFKNGIKKMICQTPWYIDDKVSGLIEFSFEIPENINHFIRD